MYACKSPSNMSKNMLKGIGIITGAISFISSITTKAPNTLPKSRMQRDSGLIKISKILMGVMIGIGSAKLLTQPFTPF